MRRHAMLACAGSTALPTSGIELLLVLVVMAVHAQQLPIAAIGWVVGVVVVAMVDGELAQVLAAELAGAAPADPGIDLQRQLAVARFAHGNDDSRSGDSANVRRHETLDPRRKWLALYVVCIGVLNAGRRHDHRQRGAAFDQAGPQFWILLVNIPVGMGVHAASLGLMPRGRCRARPARCERWHHDDALHGADESEAGLASDVVYTSFMMGDALGLAVLASIASAACYGAWGSVGAFVIKWRDGE